MFITIDPFPFFMPFPLGPTPKPEEPKATLEKHLEKFQPGWPRFPGGVMLHNNNYLYIYEFLP
jgi:hypothetical protein